MSKLPPINISLSGFPYDDAITLVKEADKAGLYATWVPEFQRDSLTYLAAMAPLTSDIKLISSVATWTRTPVNMMRACKDLDMLSHGRFMLGLGSMPASWNRDYHAIPPEKPVARMREYVETLRLLWKSDPDTPVNYEGRFYQIYDYRVLEPPDRPHLPILLGATRPNMLRTAGEIADGVLFNWNFTLDFVRNEALPAIVEGAKKSGRTLQDLHIDAGRPVVFTDDKEEADAAIACWRRGTAYIFIQADYHRDMLETLGFEEEVARGKKAMAVGDFDGVIEAINDRIVDTFVIRGAPDECLERIAEFSDFADSFSVASSTWTGVGGKESMKATRRVIEVLADAGR